MSRRARTMMMKRKMKKRARKREQKKNMVKKRKRTMRRRSMMMTTDLQQLSQPSVRRGMCRRRIGRVHPRFRKHVLLIARRRQPRGDPRITRAESRRGEGRTEVAAVSLN